MIDGIKRRNLFFGFTIFILVFTAITVESSYSLASTYDNNIYSLNAQILFERVGHISNTEIFTDVFVVDNYAYCVTMDTNLRIFNTTLSYNLVEVGSFDDGNQTFDVAVSGDYAFIIDESLYLKVIDVHTPASPELAGYCHNYIFDSEPNEMCIDGSYLYVAGDYLDGLVVFDISDPELPVQVGQVGPGYFSDVFVLNSFAYVIIYSDKTTVQERLIIYDVTNPSSPVKVGASLFAGESQQVFVTHDNVSYIANFNSGIEIIDVSQKDSPSTYATFNYYGYPNDIKVSNNLAFVTDYTNGLKAINVSNRNLPVIIGEYNFGGGNSYELEIDDDYIYIADGIDGLEIITYQLDSDEDGLSDVEETEIYGTNPNNPDSDSDAIPDGWEVDNGFNPNKSSDALEDTDEDRLLNFEEYTYGTDPRNRDTDGDGVTDGREVRRGSDPLDPLSLPVFEWTLWMTIVTIAVPSAVVLGILIVFLVLQSKKTKKQKPETQKSEAKQLKEQQKKDKKLAKEQEKKEKQKDEIDDNLVTKRLETLKKIIARYNKIDLNRLKNVLEFSNTKELDLWLLSLPEELEFYVDGENLIIPQKRFLEDNNYSQNAFNKLEQTFKQLNYSCHFCGYPIEKDTKICPDCSKEVIRCTVCKLPVNFGDDLGKCSLCENVGHLTHLQEWVKTQGKCPNCLQNIPVEGIMPIESETQPKKK